MSCRISNASSSTTNIRTCLCLSLRPGAWALGPVADPAAGGREPFLPSVDRDAKPIHDGAGNPVQREPDRKEHRDRNEQTSPRLCAHANLIEPVSVPTPIFQFPHTFVLGVHVADEALNSG